MSRPPQYRLDIYPDNLYLWLATEDAKEVARVRSELETRLRVAVACATRRTNPGLPERIPCEFRWYLRMLRPTPSLARDIARLLDSESSLAPTSPKRATEAGSDTSPATRLASAAATPTRPTNPPPQRLSAADDSLMRQLRGMIARRQVTATFADDVLRQWEETGRVTLNQLAAVRELVARAEQAASTPRIIVGGGRKAGSHRSNW